MSKEQFKMPLGETERITRTSACLCKQVAISVTGEDKEVVLCHCSNCKQRSGSIAMHNHRFMNSELTVLKGQELLKQYGDGDTQTGAILYNHFCSNCGTTLYVSTSAVEGFYGMAVGSLIEEKRQPYAELFPEDKHSWVGNLLRES